MIKENNAKPDKTIERHILDLLEVLDLLLQLEYINKDRIYELVEKACIYHDLGKLNKEFQKRVNGKNVKFNEDEEVVHNILSLYFIDNNSFESQEDYLRVAHSVLNHHNYCNNFNKITEKEKQTILDKCLTQTQMKKKWGPKYEENLKKCQQAAQETKGIVLRYHETFAWAPFHQSSNGKTRDVQEVLGNADYPYITAKECPLDKAAEDEIQVHLIEYKEIQKRCREFLVAEEQKKAENGYGYEDFDIQEWDSSGYVRKMRIGETICTGDQFRDALKLPSSSFSFYESPHGLKIATVGKGHGFGMRQWTAQEMAKDGKNYEEILQYFYEGTELHHIDE